MIAIDELPAIGQVGPIPITMIRPFKGQPRRHFDAAGLDELAESIAAEGQRTPAWVKPLTTGSFELIGGERRFRACKMAGIETLLCEVRDPKTADDQYIDSVMENFGRRDCTLLETANAVATVARIRFRDAQHGDHVNAQIAQVFARSPGWVMQMRQIARLHPKVQTLLEPPQRLHTAVAIAIANLIPELQIRLAYEVVEQKLSYKAGLEYVRGQILANKDKNVRVHSSGKTGSGRMRKPSDDHLMLKRFLDSLGQDVRIMLNIGADRMRIAFAHRNPNDRQDAIIIVQRRIVELRELEKALRSL